MNLAARMLVSSMIRTGSSKAVLRVVAALAVAPA
jgi:hypothetical protein